MENNKISLLGVVILLVTYANGQVSRGNFIRVPLTALDPLATCNDGSPATYFFRPSTTGSTLWTIYQEGGGFCYDEPSCADRWEQTQHFMTSTLLPEILNDTTSSPDVNHWGINAGDEVDNPYFYEANQVYLWYCTSDCHAGNASLGKWTFNGKRVIKTLIDHLLHVQSPSMTSATQIILTGFSAGALGTWQNADFVGEMIAKELPNTDYRAYADSGWLMDIPNYGTNDNVTRAQWQALHSNIGMVFDESCTQNYEDEIWKCGFSAVVYPYISTPLFVAGYQYDSPFLDGTPITDTKALLVLREKFLEETTIAQTLFSPNCYMHGIEAYNTRWNVITVQNSTAAEAVYKWSITKYPQKSSHIDDCSAPNCNPTCPFSAFNLLSLA